MRHRWTHMTTFTAFDGLDPRTTSAEEPSAGEVRFTTAAERHRLCQELIAQRFIVAQVEPLEPAARGRLWEVIEEAVERALLVRGAAAPGITARFGDADGWGETSAVDADFALRDQLFRARKVGAQGLCIAFGPLGPAGSAQGALEPSDCALLRFLAAATRERPLTILLDAEDERLAAYGDPVPLALLLDHAKKGEPTDAAPTVVAGPVPARCEDVRAEREPEPVSSASSTAPPPSVPWNDWVAHLAGARGPQPLAAFERLFTQSYMPLTCAIEQGLSEPRALLVHEEFRRTFMKTYSDACATFAMTHKRPRLVLDVHDTAARIARLHGARFTQLLLVDGLRWDVGRMVRDRLPYHLTSRALLTDELLLWSALPSTTWRQLETIARGLEALRTPAETDGEPEPMRARTAEFVRRIKVGGREVHKLDLVQVRIGEAGSGVRDILPALADEVAEVIAHHAEPLPSRTLLFVFGDHGFTLDRRGVAQHGGASPEEVLVPAYALFVGEVH